MAGRTGADRQQQQHNKIDSIKRCPFQKTMAAISAETVYWIERQYRWQWQKKLGWQRQRGHEQGPGCTFRSCPRVYPSRIYTNRLFGRQIEVRALQNKQKKSEDKWKPQKHCWHSHNNSSNGDQYLLVCHRNTFSSLLVKIVSIWQPSDVFLCALIRFPVEKSSNLNAQ